MIRNMGFRVRENWIPILTSCEALSKLDELLNHGFFIEKMSIKINKSEVCCDNSVNQGI